MVMVTGLTALGVLLAANQGMNISIFGLIGGRLVVMFVDMKPVVMVCKIGNVTEQHMLVRCFIL